MTTTPSRLRPGPTTPRRSRRPRARFVAAALLTVTALLVTLPDRLGGLDCVTPFTQIVAFRPYVTVAVGLAALVALVATVFRRRWWPFAAGLLAIAVAGAAVVVPRLVADPAPTGGRPLSVLVANVYQGRADPRGVADLVAADRPDLVSLPEAGARFRDHIAPLVAPLGYQARSSTPPGVPDVMGTTVLVADRLGAVDITVGTTIEVPYLQVTGGELGELRFVAIHPRSPLPDRVGQWRDELRQLAQWCAGPTPAVVAGDLNATLDHSVQPAIADRSAEWSSVALRSPATTAGVGPAHHCAS